MRFEILPAIETGVGFKNEIVESEEFYYYKYIYSYNGAGVASADFDNDGLEDLFFVSNLKECKLYLNLGDFKFKDVTNKTGIHLESGFNTGVTVVDINSDGLLDIYISRAGWFKNEQNCTNLLFINKGNLTFEEKAESYGLADANRSIQSTFFDFDKDGDLDVYIVNAPYTNKKASKLIDLKTFKKDDETIKWGGSDSFYENNGDHTFTNISEKAGIVPDIAFGLNAQIADLNNDGWLDVYVNNDFAMPDFVYINKKDGTFRDERLEMFKHQSFYSMGGDIADINNDGFLDVVNLDMNPEDYIRSKTTMSMTSISKFTDMVNKGYHYQYMHNVLQLNNGNGSFSEIANMAGMANTDWSWAPLIADFDLDGLNDIYITNGVFRDVIDKDTNKNILNLIRQKRRKPSSKEFLEYTQMLPQQKLSNYFFKNQGDLTFSNVSELWHNASPTFSNGAVFADLDNDGDLDIVVNNINEEAHILRNNTVEREKKHFLNFNFKGPENNPFGIGVTVNIYGENKEKQTRNLVNSRGYMSSVSNKLFFGLGEQLTADKVEIIWPDGKVQYYQNLKSNQLITVDYKNAIRPTENNVTSKNIKLFQDIPFNFKHIDSLFNDYDIQVLLPHKFSQLGPGVAKADINNDGIEDLYLGGGYSQPGKLLLGKKSGGFESIENKDFIADKLHEDVGAVFFDLENDGDLDLYVVSGSYEFQESSKFLADRIYKNDGKNNFKKCLDCLPKFYSAGFIVKPSDYDNDGDIDLFVGGRVIPGRYPYAPNSYLLTNSNGKYIDETYKLAKSLGNIGMVSDANWSDIDHDNDLDLIVTGEWMGIEVFENVNGKLLKSSDYKTLNETKGWWNTLLVEDIDNDGDLDIIAGNLGLNSKFHATIENPFEVYASDFDNNGTEDVFLAKYHNGKQVPIRGKSCSAQQIPELDAKIKSYKEFASRDLEGILGPAIKTALNYKVTEFRSGIFVNQGHGKFLFSAFTNELQVAPINSIIFDDLDQDGTRDLLLAGNNYQTEVETTRLDAGIGTFMSGEGNGKFHIVPNLKTGFYANRDVRDMVQIKTTTGKNILVINNNDKHELFKINKLILE
ncbi:hypothetical protein GCM10007028_19260 [Algibacter mikhailovii]|uniref:ASPIC/UnbV domain-containing protein n=2 Tax=Algibacter mikhailovii TaxID=425498 RepID=A0A918VAL9_9FLAO|nr:hypothetical protein GCM10007028_19260 [Algibacter mikhailovii]